MCSVTNCLGEKYLQEHEFLSELHHLSNSTPLFLPSQLPFAPNIPIPHVSIFPNQTPLLTPDFILPFSLFITRSLSLMIQVFLQLLSPHKRTYQPRPWHLILLLLQFSAFYCSHCTLPVSLILSLQSLSQISFTSHHCFFLSSVHSGFSFKVFFSPENSLPFSEAVVQLDQCSMI